MADIDDLFLPPNAGAFEKKETRTGPPLKYVAEKVKNALASSHEAFNAIQHDIPNPLGSPAYATFKYILVAFLALHNMLGLIEDMNKVEALLRLRQVEFGEWLDRVEREGSVLG